MKMATSAELLHRFTQSRGICTDSRKLANNDLYLALKGASFNGNDFAKSSLKAGASCVVVDDADIAKELPQERTLLVHDGLEALQELATSYRKKIIPHIPMLSICGSNGKTTTKNLCAAVLGKKYTVYKTEGNFNNHIGVPLSVLSIKKEYDFAVIEIGANHIGEHTLLCGIAQPDYALITNCGKDHLEGYGNSQNVVESAKEVISFGEKTSTMKVLFLNTDDDALRQLANTTSLPVWSFGEQSHVARSLQHTQGTGTTAAELPMLHVTLHATPNNSQPLQIATQLFGHFQVYNVLAATAVGEYAQVSREDIKKSIQHFIPDDNRGQYIVWNNNRVLLDAYNANPSSVNAILESFIDSSENKKIVILGAMSELGSYEEEEHTALLKYLQEHSFYKVVLIGKAFQKLLPPLKNYHFFQKTEDATTWLKQQSFKDCFILAKGSRIFKLETLFCK